MIYFTEIEHVPVFDVVGDYVGRIVEICIDPEANPRRVAAYIVERDRGPLLALGFERLQALSISAAHANVPASQIPHYAPQDAYIRVKKDLLDQQIIDVNDRKVVRVNDVDFDIQPVDGHVQLRVMAVNVGLAAAFRRLLQGLVAKRRLREIARHLPSRSIPWEFVNLIEPDPARRLKLKISYEGLARLHPADLADILERLSAQEQTAVLSSLDDETAAEALSEISTHLQASIVAGLRPEKAADLLEEMPPDEAADLLLTLRPETTSELLADMDREEAQEVQALLRFEQDQAGALMTTDFVAVPELATVQQAVEALRNFDTPLETLHIIFLVNAAQALVGAVPLARILLTPGPTPLRDLSLDPLLYASAQQSQKEVIELFLKYNLLSLPVVDDEQRLVGVITADDIIEVVTSRH